MKIQLFQMEIMEGEVKQNENRIESLFEEKLHIKY